jgi:hypothetical protein
VSIKAQFWSIPYESLITKGDRPLTTFYQTSAIPDEWFDWSKISPLSTPPKPGWETNPGLDEQTYWEQMGRYYWYWIVK